MNTCCEIRNDVKGMVIQSFFSIIKNKKTPCRGFPIMLRGFPTKKSGHKLNYHHFPPSIKKGPIPFLAKTCSQIVPRPWPKPPEPIPTGAPVMGNPKRKTYIAGMGIIPKNTMGTLLGVHLLLSLEWGHLHCLVLYQVYSYEPRKKTSYVPFYWLVNRDPYNGFFYNPYVTE